MKKFLFLVILSLTLFSCEGPMGPQGPQGVPGEGMFWKYYTYTVKSQDWQLVTSPDGFHTYYMYEFQNKDITDDLYIDGYVLGYLVQSPGADNEVITPLPYTIHKGEADGDNALLWTETYTYDYMPGSVAFYVQYSDFIEQQPGDMVFRLVLNN